MPPHSRSQRRRQNTRQQQRPVQQRPAVANDTHIAVDQTATDTLVDDGSYTDIALHPAQPIAPVMNIAAVAPVLVAPAMPTRAAALTPASATAASARTAAAPARAAARRTRPRTTLEPVDYTKDYAAARRDLRWIVLWAGLLFVVMIVLKVSGIV